MTKRMIFHLLILVLTLAVLSGCASRGEIVRFKNQLDYLEKSNRRLERRVADLDSLLEEQLKETQRVRADINSSFGSVDERLNVVEGWLKDTDSRFNEFLRKMEQTRERMIPEETLSEGDTTRPTVSFDPQTLYDEAYMNLVKGNYDLAILGFTDYLSYFPRSSLASTAQCWIAECYYTKKDFQRASEEFGKLLQKYPKSDKIPTALYKLGLIQLELNNRVEANKYFGELLDKYPRAPETELAKEIMGVKD